MDLSGHSPTPSLVNHVLCPAHSPSLHLSLPVPSACEWPWNPLFSPLLLPLHTVSSTLSPRAVLLGRTRRVMVPAGAHPKGWGCVACVVTVFCILSLLGGEGRYGIEGKSTPTHPPNQFPPPSHRGEGRVPMINWDGATRWHPESAPGEYSDHYLLEFWG